MERNQPRPRQNAPPRQRPPQRGQRSPGRRPQEHYSPPQARRSTLPLYIVIGVLILACIILSALLIKAKAENKKLKEKTNVLHVEQPLEVKKDNGMKEEARQQAAPPAQQSEQAPDNVPVPKEEPKTISAILDDLGVSYEQTAIAYSMVGAIAGEKCKIGEGAIEMYYFDVNSDAYKTAENIQQLTAEDMGMSFPAVVKDGKAFVASDVDAEIVEKVKNALMN